MTEKHTTPMRQRNVLIWLLPVLSLWLPGMRAQSGDASPEFDVVSVKILRLPANEGEPAQAMGTLPLWTSGLTGLRVTPGRIEMQWSARRLIAYAYSLEEWQVNCDAAPCAHLPSKSEPWVGWYDFTATYPLSADPARIRLMLQRTLADRFGLKFHREETSMQAYILTVSSAGLKMPLADPPAGGGDGQIDLWGRPGIGPGAPVPAFGLSTKIRRPGETPGDLQPGVKISLIATKIPSLLGDSEARCVDRTGLDGYYKVDLTVTGQPTLKALNDALEKQLGLHVEKGTVPSEKLIVDEIRATPVLN